jgi:hypothetical protein
MLSRVEQRHVAIIRSFVNTPKRVTLLPMSMPNASGSLTALDDDANASIANAGSSPVMPVAGGSSAMPNASGSSAAAFVLVLVIFELLLVNGEPSLGNSAVDSFFG